MRNYAQVRLDMRKHANARNIARLCTLGAAWRGWQDRRAAARVRHAERGGVLQVEGFS
jgi:hypothetical protein